MGKRHVRHHDDSFDDSTFVSDGFDDVDYDALMEATERRNARQKRRHGKTVRNRFDDYEQERWLSRQVNDWDDDVDFDDDLSFDDSDN